MLVFITCGCDSMSRLHEHILPSVETLIRLCAFCVPTTFRQYRGCCKIYIISIIRTVIVYKSIGLDRDFGKWAFEF